MKQLLIVTDLDGTLLNNRNALSEENEMWIKKFKANGGLFTFATGRMESTTQIFMEKLELDVPIISYNGAKLFCPITKASLFEQKFSIPSNIWEQILGNRKEFGLFIYQDGKPFVLERNDIVEEFERKERMQCITGDLKDFINEPITKVLIIMKEVSRTENVPELKEIEQAIRKNEFKCEMVFSESNYLEILPEGISKGVGVSKLRDYLGIHNLYILAFGDNLNDISLLEAADLGIAVQNARQELKAISNIVTKQSNDENAIACVIKEILKEKNWLEKVIGISVNPNLLSST